MSNFAEYPRPSAGPTPTPYYRGPGVYFDAIGESFNLVKPDLGHWAAATILYFVVGIALSVPLSLIQGLVIPQMPAGTREGLSIAFVAVSLLVNLLTYAVQGALLVGMMLMGVRKSRGEYINVGMVFEPLQRFGAVLGANLLYVAIVYASILACVLPFFYFAPVLALTPLVCYMQGVGPVQAVKTTYQACKRHWVGLFGLLFVLGLLQLLGGCACGVGLLVTWPMYCVTFGIHYRAFFESAPAPMEPTHG